MEKNQNSKEFKLSELKPLEIAEHPYVKSRFIDTLKNIHHLSDGEAESCYEREILYYRKALNGSDKLKKCTNVSLFSAFMEIAINNLSIQPGGKADAFIESRGINVGTRDNPSWEQTASINVSAYGELKMRMRAGQIIRMNNPIVIYDGDYFQPRTNERGELTIDYKPAIPRKSNTIIGCYACLILPNNGIDFKWLLQDDIDRLKKYSIPKSGGNNAQPNALYSSHNGQIDPGFLEAKTIKHAMRTLPKLRTSDAVTFEGEEETTAGITPAEEFAPDKLPEDNKTNTVTMNDESDIF